MGLPMDYDGYAATYARVRGVMPWVLTAVAGAARVAPVPAALEVGCGTGNYVEALAATVPGLRCAGLDRSREMLAQAAARGTARVQYALADADRALPYHDGAFGLAFAVDVVHHLTRLDLLFAELGRVLAPGGLVLVATDGEENLLRRSLTHFFPELLAVERARYPALDALDRAAAETGFVEGRRALAEGEVALDDAFVAKLGAKCSSGMRLIPDAAHAAGMARVRAAAARGERWLSSYAVLTWRRPR